jgi:hypothetical protein
MRDLHIFCGVIKFPNLKKCQEFFHVQGACGDSNPKFIEIMNICPMQFSKPRSRICQTLALQCHWPLSLIWSLIVLRNFTLKKVGQNDHLTYLPHIFNTCSKSCAKYRVLQYILWGTNLGPLVPILNTSKNTMYLQQRGQSVHDQNLGNCFH